MRDFSNPATKFVEITPEMERVERSHGTGASVGMMASWNTPVDALDPSLVPEDKRRMLEASQANRPQKGPEQPAPQPKPQPVRMPVVGVVTIPPQAMKQYRDFIKNISTAKVQMNTDEARLFLDVIEAMPTPKQLSDAKAIIRLSEQLEGLLK